LIRSDGTERPAMVWLREYLTETSVQATNLSLPQKCVLYQNYPNPFNPTTSIRYALNRSGQVKVVIYNTLGVPVRVLLDAVQNTGEYSLLWDATDDQHNLVPSGLYFYRLEANGEKMQNKMVLTR